MRCIVFCILSLVIILTGCGTVEGYRTASERCSYYFQRNKLDEASGACYRALFEARGAGLGPKAEADAMYALYVVNKRRNDMASAEQYLLDSLSTLEKLPSVQSGNNEPISSVYARRLAELVLMQEEQSKFAEACQSSKRLEPFEKNLYPQLLNDLIKQSRVYRKECEKSGQETK